MKHRKKRNFCSILQRVIRKCANTFVKQAFMFCRETGLHGCKYIYEKQRSTIERVAWAITVFTSVCIALGMLKFTYDYYNEYSILSVIESTHNGIWNYPFPAVTVCDLNRVSLKLSRKLVDNLTLPSTVSKEFVIQEMSLLDTLIYPGKYGSPIRSNLSRLQLIFDMNDLSIPEVVNLVTRSCETLLESCQWKTQERSCASLFQRTYSRHGSCCSFNYFTHDKIVKEPNLKPHKMSSCGYQSGLNILLNLDPSDYHSGIVSTTGVTIIIHDPYDYPDYNSPSKLIGLNKYSFLTVKPVEIYSSTEIRWVSTKQCIYSDELDETSKNKLSNGKFFHIKYSFQNCIAFCRAVIIKKKCGCIPYYYKQNSTRICTLRDVECLEAFKYWYDTSWPGADMSKTVPMVEMKYETLPCECKPDCNFYKYFIENSAGNLNKYTFHNGLAYTTNSGRGKPWQNQTIVHIFFGDLVSIQYRRDIRYSWRHFFATSGGLLGVFAGFSFMSMFEIVYFFVIRVLTDACIKRRNMRNK